MFSVSVYARAVELHTFHDGHELDDKTSQLNVHMDTTSPRKDDYDVKVYYVNPNGMGGCILTCKMVIGSKQIVEHSVTMKNS
jgi:hypothetical protein